MYLYQIIILALIQGLTEFLPISSSAHLILPSQVLGWKDQGMAFDLAVHLGTLFAVLIYMRREVYCMARDCLVSFKTRQLTADARVGFFIVLATLPAVVIGFFVKDWVALHLRHMLVIAIASIGFGIILAIADRYAKARMHSASLDSMTLNRALAIGLSQALAFIPGTSRSGITITAALALGFSRQAALRFSFFLSIPIILAGSMLSFLDLLEAGVSSSVWQELVFGMSLAGVSAFACIHLFLQWVDRVGMMPFVIYRVFLGLVLVWVYLQVPQ